MGRVPNVEAAELLHSAYDARTGEQKWRFVTIATIDQPGGNTWGTCPSVRAGGATWITGI